jgi:septal ring factor EnvC (AmiA/AmiB activator)
LRAARAARIFAMPSALRLLPLPALALACALAIASAPAAGAPRDLEGQRAAAERLRAEVDAESERIAETRAGLAGAEEELAALTAQADRRQAQLDEAQDRLVRLRARLTRLERREAEEKDVLARTLVASYKSDDPNLVTVLLDVDGFDELLERVHFYEQVARQNATVLDSTREASAAVSRQGDAVERQRARYSELAQAAIEDRDRAAVLRSALLQRQEQQLAERRGAASRLSAVRKRIDRIERDRATAARSAEVATTATEAAPKITGSKGADAIVAKVVAAANEIATTPYVYGGGHGGGSSGYDCSGSISYALAGAGLLSQPLDSSGFMGWGEAGEGQRITVYANPGHAFMVVDGRRFDTSALSGGGTRWTSESRSTSGYVARHPRGL